MRRRTDLIIDTDVEKSVSWKPFCSRDEKYRSILIGNPLFRLVDTIVYILYCLQQFSSEDSLCVCVVFYWNLYVASVVTADM